jgi:hypothetical protein
MVVLLALAACGGADGTSPDPGTKPPPPPPPAPVATISLDGAFSLETYTTRQLTAVTRDSTGTELTGRAITYSSTDTAVAKVSASGLVSGISKGTATIYANSEGKGASTTVSVVPMPGTVVLRVITTDKNWGQEEVPGWPLASPVKGEAGYSLYDLEIGRDAGGVPSYLALYRFKDVLSQSLDPTSFRPYMAASLLKKEEIALTSSPESRSTEVLAAFKPLIDEIMDRERPTRIVLEYSGHGNPVVFFEGALTFPDAREFLKYLRKDNPSVPLILDFSTNCDVGFFDFAVNFYDIADYLLAGEREYGGYSDGGANINDYLATLHDRNLQKFWQKDNDVPTALNAVTANRKAFWQVVKQGLIEVKKEESLAVYDLSKFTLLMDALANDPAFDPLGLTPYAHDIGTFVRSTDDAALKSAFGAFQLQYISTRGIVEWQTDTWGFSVFDANALASYLAAR